MIFCKSAFKPSTSAPPFPITSPGFAVYTLTLTDLAVLSISILEIPLTYNFFFTFSRIFLSSTN